MSPAAGDHQKAVHATHERALAKAREFWAREQTHPRASYQAGQAAYAIGDISFKLDSFDSPVQDALSAGRDHLKQYDQEIAKSLCQHKPDPGLTYCFEQDSAVQAYNAARPVVLKRIEDLEATLSADKATMKGIVDDAQAYSSSK